MYLAGLQVGYNLEGGKFSNLVGLSEVHQDHTSS